jgi:hypothetical protein
MSWLSQPGDDQEVTDPNLLLAEQESGFQAPDVEVDQTAILNQMFVNLMSRASGWVPHDGNLDTWMLEAWSEVAAELRALNVDVPRSIFSVYGTLILNIPPRLATRAVGSVTFTAVDDQGYTIDTGTTFALARSGNDLVAFQTAQPGTIPVGLTQVSVPFVAVEEGYNGNGLAGDGQMLDALAWVASVTVPVATYDGQDAESPEDYVNRLANLFPAVGLRPILPIDFAILPLQLVPGIGRAVAMNLFSPDTGTWNNVRTVTVIVTGPDGLPVPGPVKQQVVDLLESLREVNWVVHVIDPTYDPVDIDFDVVAFVGQDEQRVYDNCVEAVQAWLDPSNYRLGEASPAIYGGEVIFPPQVNGPPRRQTIWINELIARLDRAMGVDRVVSATINGVGADYDLPDPYSLPLLGQVTGTVEGGTVSP